MIIKRTWAKRVKYNLDKHYVGYFLLGFIPLYISIEENYL